ncbi:MAG: hypothetical protein WBE26_13835 [Phycisphaerae bacterium]
MRQCPQCKNWTLEFDDYFGRFRCFDGNCGWMPPSSVERAMRLQESYTEPIPVWSEPIDKLGLTFKVEYDKENDALLFDFGLETPTLEFPEADGRMVWKIARISGSVAGFIILKAKEWGVSEVNINFDARKADIEEGFRRTPEAVWGGRVTRVLIERVKVTAHSLALPDPAQPQALTNAFQQALKKFQASLTC